MKTIYIPKGQTVTYENLHCENLIVKGRLVVHDQLYATHIDGKGFLQANTIQAENIAMGHLVARGIICQRLLAKTVQATEIVATSELVASQYLEADSVSTEILSTVKCNVSQIEADQVIHLRPTIGGMFGLLLASYVRSILLPLMIPQEEDDYYVDGEYTPVEKAEETVEDRETVQNISHVVEEILAQKEQKQKDAELEGLVAMCNLCQKQGCTLTVTPSPSYHQNDCHQVA